MRQVAAEPHATAHCETVQKADDRLMAGREFGVEAVFIGPKLPAIIEVSGQGCFIHGRYVATGAKGTLTRAFKQDHVNIWIGFPRPKVALNLQAHLIGQSVQRARPVECEPPGLAVFARDEITHARKPLATIIRMISLVPSKI